MNKLKKSVSIITVILIIMSLFTGCNTQNEEGVLPPTRLGNETEISALLARRYTFEEAYQEADVVAHVKVGNWLGEEEEKRATYFDATIVEQYKGNAIDEIVLFQDGTSKGTLKGYPLFTYGNEMLVFLKEAVETEYEDAYWIIGAYTTMLDVVYDEGGNLYYMDRYGTLGETIEASMNSAGDAELRSRLYEKASEKDEMVTVIGYQYKHIYKKEILDALMESIETE